MTIQEFLKHVPLDNKIHPLVFGNGIFCGINLKGGRFIIISKSSVFDRDYELLNVSVEDGKLCLDVDCN